MFCYIDHKPERIQEIIQGACFPEAIGYFAMNLAAKAIKNPIHPRVLYWAKTLAGPPVVTRVTRVNTIQGIPAPVPSPIANFPVLL